MMSAPVASPKYAAGSTFRKYTSPRESRIVKPGVIPPDLPRVTVQVPTTSGPSPRFGPRASSSMDIARTPIRFSHQLESGTSPRVFTFRAGGMRPFFGPSRRKVFSKPSQPFASSITAGGVGTCRSS